MRAITVPPGVANSARLDDIPPPPSSDGAILVRTMALGVCGTDREIVAGDYILQGRRAEAEQLFRRLVALCNDVGLLSEEYDFRDRRLAGNFPQAFSHVGLVNTAFNLTRAAKPVEQRAQAADAKPPLEREQA